MRSLDEMLQSAQPDSEWACTPCRYPGCDQRFVTEYGESSHHRRAHAADAVEVEA
jgi:hypothetical protein